MSTKLLVLFFSLFLTSSLIVEAGEDAPDNFAADKPSILFNEECAEGECVELVIEQFQATHKLAKDNNCLPEEGSTTEQAEDFYKSTLLSEDCVSYLRKLKELEDHLKMMEAELVTHLEGENGRCDPENPEDEILTGDITHAVAGDSPELQCTEERKEEVKSTCGRDLACVAKATFRTISFGIPLHLLQGKITEESNRATGEGCGDYNDNCIYQLASGFGSAVAALWEGGKFLAQAAWSGIKGAAVSTWDWLTGNEEATSNTALAMAEASEDEGVFAAILADPLGSLSKAWEGLMSMMGHWLSHDVFCQKWEGLAHESECKEPYTGFECMSCRSMINGGCNVIGVALAEVVPAFLTGGLVTAVKWGAKGGVTLARSLKLSSRTRNLLKNSNLAQMSGNAAKKALHYTGTNRVIAASRTLIKGTLSKIQRFMLSPARVGFSKSAEVMANLGSKLGTFKVVRGGLTFIKYGLALGKGLGKVVLYAVENPLTRFAYNVPGKLGPKTVFSPARAGPSGAKIVAALEVADEPFSKMTRAQEDLTQMLSARADGLLPDSKQFDDTLKAFESSRDDYLAALASRRNDLGKSLLVDDPKMPLSHVIDELFPELRYTDDVSKTLSSARITSAEKELRTMISRIDDPVRKQQLIQEFNAWRANPERVARKLDDRLFFSPTEVHLNARLAPQARSERAFELIGISRESIDPARAASLARGLEDAHKIGASRGAGVFEYTPAEIAQKYRTLRTAGYSSDEASNLIRSGLAGDVADLAKFERLDKALIDELVRGAPDGADSRIFADFLNNNKKTLDTMIKSGDLKPQDLVFDRFSIMSNVDGVKYGLIKDSIGRQLIQRLDGKRLGNFTLARQLELEEFTKKYGPIFKGKDGEYQVFGNLYGTDLPQFRTTRMKPPVNGREFDSWVDEIVNQFPVNDPNSRLAFTNFTSRNKKELIDLFKTGKILPEEFTPQNLHRVYSPDIDGYVDLFLPLNKGDSLSEGFFFVANKKDNLGGMKNGRLGTLEHQGSGFELVWEDGKFIRATENELGFPSFQRGDGAITHRTLIESNYWHDVTTVAKKYLSESEYKVWENAMQGTAHHIEDSLVKQIFGPLDFSPKRFKTFKGADGKDYGAFVSSDFMSSPVIRLDGSAIQGKNHIASMGEILAKTGDDINFTDGSFVRSWKQGDQLRFEYTAKVEREIRFLADDIQRKFDFVDSSGKRVNEEFITFVRDNESILKDLMRSGSLKLDELDPTKFTIMKSDRGEEFFTLLRDDDLLRSIYIPKNPDLLPPQKAFLYAEDLKGLGNEFTSSSSLKLVINEGRSVEFSVINSKIGFEEITVFRQSEVIGNSSLSYERKLQKAREILGLEQLTKNQETAINQVLLIGKERGAGVFDYTQAEMTRAVETLRSSGFTDIQSRALIRSGVVARPPNRFAGTRTGLFADDFSSMTAIRFDDKLLDLEESLIGAIGPDGKPLTTAQAIRVKNNIEALYFIDHNHSLPFLEDIVLGKTHLSESQLFAKYNNTGAKAFENYLATNKWLLEETPEISMDTFRRIQSRFMEDGIEKLDPQYVGQVRDGGVIGNVRSTPVGDDIVNEVRANPYTDFTVESTRANGLKTGQIEYPNVPKNIKDTALARIENSHPTLVEELKIARDYLAESQALAKKREGIPKIKQNLEKQVERLELRKAELQGILVKNSAQNEEYLAILSEIDQVKNRLTNISDEILTRQAKISKEMKALEDRYRQLDVKDLQREFVTALTEERIDWYNNARAALGPLDSPDKVERFADIVAEFQRDLVSIHPFRNGNGRSTRQFALYYPLMKEGLPPPRILDTNVDLYKPLGEWQKQVRDGIFASQRLITDLTERARVGLPLEDSMELLRPMGERQIRRPMFRVSSKKGGQEWFEGPELTRVDRNQFNHYVKEVISENPDLLNNAKVMPTAAWDRIHSLAEEKYLRNNVLFDHRPKSGNNVVREMSLGMPTEDFKSMFGRASFDDPTKYDYKMSRWYSDEINWRGIAAFKGSPIRDQEGILDMFRKLDRHMTSNDILGKGTADPEKIRQFAIKNMDEMEIAARRVAEEEGNIADWARWHSEATPPYYGRSIGYSTSKKESVGKAFGMGAMVNGKFGKLNKTDKVSEYLLPERQARVAQRINVGTRRSIKDVEIEWMRSLRDDFRYQYGQQREVMGIGAADPDAVMIVKTYDDQGQVVESFVRNPEKPYEVWIVKGDADPGVRPPKGSEFQTIDLRGARSPANQ